MIPEGSQEFAFELDEGPAMLTLPQGIGKGSTEDLEDWLKLVIRKVKRATKTPASAHRNLSKTVTMQTSSRRAIENAPDNRGVFVSSPLSLT